MRNGTGASLLSSRRLPERRPIISDKDAAAWVHRQAELQAQITRQEQRFREVEAEWVERYEKLEAEVGRLTVELTHRVGWEERCLDAEAALATLRAENARLRAAEAECRNSRGFVAAENERLRTALTEIAETCSVKKIDSQMTCKCAGGMARRALVRAKAS
jgi:chromosome segregation ATPase